MKKKTTGTKVKRLSLKDLDEKIGALTALVEKLTEAQTSMIGGKVVAAQDKTPTAAPLVSEEKEEVPLKKGETYIFCSGPHRGMQLRIAPGHKTDYNPMTGEYTLIEPEIIKFGAIDEDTGPAGYYVTKDLEKVKKIRAALKKVKTREIVEVTGDKAFAHVVGLVV